MVRYGLEGPCAAWISLRGDVALSEGSEWAEGSGNGRTITGQRGVVIGARLKAEVFYCIQRLDRPEAYSSLESCGAGRRHKPFMAFGAM